MPRGDGNQYTIARQKGIKPGDPDWPKRLKKKPPLNDRSKALISAARVIQVLEKEMNDKDNPGATRVAAAKALFDKVMPSLSTVDAKTLIKTEKMSEEALVAQLRVLIENNPELTSKILGDAARGKPIREVKTSEDSEVQYPRSIAGDYGFVRGVEAEEGEAQEIPPEEVQTG